MKREKKRSMMMVAASIALASAFSSIAAIGVNQMTKPSNHPWDYTLFSFGTEGTLHDKADSLIVTGDIRSNGNIRVDGKDMSISGNMVASGEIIPNDAVIEAGLKKSGADVLEINDVFNQVFTNALENAEVQYIDAISERQYEITNPVVSNNVLTINIAATQPPSSSDDEIETESKFGVFGAGFLTSVYEHPEIWNQVLPVFPENIELKSLDLLELGKKSAFIPVAGGNVSENWGSSNRLPDNVFQSYFSSENVTSHIEQMKEDNPVFSVCVEDYTTIHCGYDNTLVNPKEASEGDHLVVEEGNLALNGNLALDGNYENVEEIRLDNWGGSQLIGSYPNLKYIYKTSWGNLNLAGDFPSLECIYMPGGQLLLGNGNDGFYASNAIIINEGGTIIIYTANDVTLENCSVLTTQNIVIRGDGKEAETSKFRAENSLFAANGAIGFEDIHDEVTEEFRKIPVFYSNVPMSFVNCNFNTLQGCFLSVNGAITLTETEIDTLRGYLFSPNGMQEITSTMNPETSQMPRCRTEQNMPL